jgi:hypothetical protein
VVTNVLSAQDGPKLKLWIDSASVDSFSCGGLSIRLVDYDGNDKWLGHVFELRMTNPSDSAGRFDPAAFAAVLRDGTQRTFPGTDELAQRVINGWWARRELQTSAKQEQKLAEFRSRRDLIAEDVLPGASSVKRVALGPSVSGGIAFGGRSAEELREFKAADIPLTLYCRGRRVGVVSKPVK